MSENAANAGWSAPEKWAWSRICKGRIADFSARFGELDPRASKAWRPNRILSCDFLRSILFDKAWTDLVPIEGVRIRGARYTEQLVLSHGHVQWPLWLEACRCDQPADFSYLQVDGRLSLRESAFHGSAEAPALTLANAKLPHADLAGASFKEGIAAPQAAIDGILDLNDASVDGVLDLSGASVGYLRLNRASLRDVGLQSCDVAKDLELIGATVEGSLDMSRIHVGQDLGILGSRKAPAVLKKGAVLQGARVDGNLSLIGATVEGGLEMNDLCVKKHLFLRAPITGEDKGATRFGGAVDLTNSTIDGHVMFIGATFEAAVNMQGIKVGANLAAWLGETQATIFHGAVSLACSEVKGSVDFSGALFRQKADFTTAHVHGTLTLDGVTCEEAIVMDGLVVSRHLFMGGAATFNEINMGNADIGGQFRCLATCDGDVSFASTKVGTHLFMRAEFGLTPVFGGKFDLSYAEIKGVAEFGGASFGADIVMESIKVGRRLYLNASFNSPVVLFDGDVGGDLTISTALTDKNVDLRGLHVGQNLYMGGEFRGAIDASNSQIDRMLDITVASLNSLNLGGAVIKGQVRLGMPQLEPDAPVQTATWSNAGELDLRDAKAGSLQDWAKKGSKGWQSSWPAEGKVQLDGFTYERLGGSGVPPSQQMIERPVKYYVEWLGLDQPFSPQPYEHLAAVLRQAGETEKANRILYAGRERARKSAWSPLRPLKNVRGIPRWLGLGLLKVSIGYGIGYRFFYALFWVLLLTALGVYTLGGETVGAPGAEAVRLTSWVDKAVYSFDQLLPIIELNHNFSDVALPESVEHYFYWHRLLGFLLGTFIAAGVAGLTQRAKF